MNILFHPLHCGYDTELSKIGHEFYLLDPTWEGSLGQYKTRPLPSNFHVEWDREKTHLDVAIIGDHWKIMKFGLDKFVGPDVPLIFNFLADWGEPGSTFPSEWERRADTIVFLSKDSADRWSLQDPSKRRIIEYGIDVETHKGYLGIKGVVAVGHDIPKRGEKGKENLVELAKAIKIDLIGYGNEKFDFAIGPTPEYKEFIEKLRRYKVYVSPSRIASMATIEAMAMGMPVVTFPTFNNVDLMIDEYSCFVVNSVQQAVDRIHELLADDELCRSIGNTARAMVMGRFPVRKFKQSWEGVIHETTANALTNRIMKRTKEEEAVRRQQEEFRKATEWGKLRERADELKKKPENENRLTGMVLEAMLEGHNEEEARKKAAQIIEILAFKIGEVSKINNAERARGLRHSLDAVDKVTSVIMDSSIGTGIGEQDARKKALEIFQFVRPK